MLHVRVSGAAVWRAARVAHGACSFVVCAAGCVMSVASAQVVGVGPPSMSLIDPSNPETGGVRLVYLGGAASDSNPYRCDVNPATGAEVGASARRTVVTCGNCATRVSMPSLLSCCGLRRRHRAVFRH